MMANVITLYNQSGRNLMGKIVEKYSKNILFRQPFCVPFHPDYRFRRTWFEYSRLTLFAGYII